MLSATLLRQANLFTQNEAAYHGAESEYRNEFYQLIKEALSGVHCRSICLAKGKEHQGCQRDTVKGMVRKLKLVNVELVAPVDETYRTYRENRQNNSGGTGQGHSPPSGPNTEYCMTASSENGKITRWSCWCVSATAAWPRRPPTASRWATAAWPVAVDRARAVATRKDVG
jgi:hypothetical protein